jgi:sRNA-binding carbon storage regulator CsrA
MALVLTRKKGDRVTLFVPQENGEPIEIEIKIGTISQQKCKLEFEAPKSVDIRRHDMVKQKMPRYGELVEPEDANDYRLETAKENFEIEMGRRDFSDRTR